MYCYGYVCFTASFKRNMSLMLGHVMPQAGQWCSQVIEVGEHGVGI